MQNSSYLYTADSYKITSCGKQHRGKLVPIFLKLHTLVTHPKLNPIFIKGYVAELLKVIYGISKEKKQANEFV
jgi:hypothetical protein